MGDRRWLARVLAAVMVCGTGLGCSAQPSTSATIDVDAPAALVDQPVRVRISGVSPRAKVVVTSEATDYRGQVWRGEATFTANDDGVVDVDRATPDVGTYRSADGMGLFWSMEPANGDADRSRYVPLYPELAGAFDVRLTVRAGGREIARRTVSREWISSGVIHRALNFNDDKMAGHVFLPPAGSVRRPGVLLVGGSEGGISMKFEAALLASHGYPALALGYFGMPGLPITLHDIPLEYFASASRWLIAQGGADTGKVVVIGYSRGSEAALLLAENYPDLIGGAILYAPNDSVAAGLPGGGNAWTHGGARVPQTPIPVAHVAGPVLAIAGDDDRLWNSAFQARQIMKGLETANVTFAHQVLIYPGAGHAVGTFPYLAAGTWVMHPVTKTEIPLGGTRAGDAAAKRDGWTKVLAFLAKVNAGT